MQFPLIVITIGVAVVGAYRLFTAMGMEIPAGAEAELMESLTKTRQTQMLQGGALMVAGIIATAATLIRMAMKAMQNSRTEQADDAET